MRFSVFLALVIATFVASISFASAESDVHLELERNLRSQGVADKADEVVKIFKADEIAKFLQSTQKKAMLTKAKNLEEAGNLRKAEILRDTAGPISSLNKGQKEKLSLMLAEMAKKEPEKLSIVVAKAAKDPSKLVQAASRVAKKDPVKWSNLEVVIAGLVFAVYTYLGTKIASAW